MASNSVVLKQDSPFYEHFYKSLTPFKHFIPFRRDLKDLVEKIEWAKKNDKFSMEIMKNGQMFANENLLPRDIYCYHVHLFKKWSDKLVGDISILSNMERLVHPKSPCKCNNNIHDEL